MRLMVVLCMALLATLPCLAQGAEGPLARPAPPEVEIRGAAGTRTVYYWAFARDARGHSRYSEPAVVTNAPDALSAQNAVVLTPAPVPGATEYGIITSRVDAPRDVKIEVKAKGDKTFYYWMQARNGRTVWSPLSGPFKAERCAGQPENTLRWSDTGAEFYYIYRTETPRKPVGWRCCVILTAGKKLSWSDKGLNPDSRIIYPAGNPSEPPEGYGAYLVGTSKGGAIVDEGQKLDPILIYDMNTTDPAYRRFKPEVKGYEPSGSRGAFQFDFDHRMKSPKYSWDLLNGIAIHQHNVAGGLNTYPGVRGIHHENAKNTYNGIDIHQFNYTPGQHSPYLTFMYNYGVGDNVLFHAALEQVGQNRTAGDEGSEFFSLHMSRRLRTNRARVAADAAAGDTYLKIAGNLGTIAGGRGIVNLTQKYTAGKAHVEGAAVAVGTDTNWTPEMEGRWMSFDADTTKKGIRQWYLVERYISPTRLQLFAYTYWGKYNYKGNARQDGGYMICPYTEMADGDASTARGLRVAPLSCAWKAGDEIEVIAGPQTTFRLGWWEMGGEFLPQDHIAGLGITYGGDKDPGEGALIVYGNDKGRWPSAVECHNLKSGMMLYSADVGMVFHRASPTVFRVIDDPSRYQLSWDKEGIFLEDLANRRWVELGKKGLTLHGQATIKGTGRTRGRTTFSGDGKTTRFTIAFPTAFENAPFVVASSNLPIGMGVTDVAPDGCTVTFAAPPPAGKDNIVVTWMVQE